ncbi:MAG: hypothetical protein AABX11_03695 [Nanoarchaeota archaeon]
MDKIELEKNVLDLAYQRNLQLLNSILIIGAGSIVAYFAGLILDKSKLFPYSVILLVLVVVTLIFYRNINKTLKEISYNIRNLNEEF